MKRRTFIQSTAVGMIAGSVLGSCGDEQKGDSPNVITQPNLRWRLTSSYPRSLDTLYGTMTTFTERVSALTEGRFQIRAYPPGELVPGTEVLGAVQNGTVQMGHTASYYYVGKNPALAFDTCVPFGLTARQQNAWLYAGGGLELMREMFADFNIINFPCGNTGAQMGGWFRREINSLQDLRGLKMRIPGLGGEVMSALGVTVQLMAGGEIYPALERGAIDATEWVGPYDDEKLGFHQIVKQYYYPGWWEPGPTIVLYVNRDAWDTLPAVYQEAVTIATQEANSLMRAAYDARNQEALPRILDAGVVLKRFPDDVMQAAERQSFEMMEAQAAEDAGYNKVYAAFKKWREDSYRWFSTAEQAMATYAYSRNDKTDVIG